MSAEGRCTHTPQGGFNGRIWRANLDGTGLEAIVSGLQRPRDVALDVTEGRVYWVDETAGALQGANLDGSDVQTVASGLDAPDSLAIVAVPPNEPPDCDSATADPQEIWPPDHRVVPIEITGVTDPDGDPVTIVADQILQNEPVKGMGSGSTAPDAVLVPLVVRAEREGGGSGRIYVIDFTADDGQGGVCEGTVTVCVPNSRASGDCDGPLYDSTACGIGFELALLLPPIMLLRRRLRS
jgi:hypothetical protein